jgi:hypothetical protein
MTSPEGDQVDDTEETQGAESSDTEETDPNAISDELEKAFENVIFNKVCVRDLVSRRMEVRDAWEQRYFWRGHQYLDEGAYGQWAFAGEGLTFSAKGGGDEAIDETNIYQAYGLQLLGVLTQNNPSVRFFPIDNKKKTDLVAASAANTMKYIIERTNNTISLQEDIVRYLYTDGRAVIVTSYDEKADKQELTAYGTLETKLPIQIRHDLKKCFYVQVTDEVDLIVAKAMYPDKAKEIRCGSAPAAESEFERLARVACMQGMRPTSGTGADSLQWNCTWQRTWLRPEAFIEIEDEKLRTEAETTFPDGVCVTFIGKTFCEARACHLEDEITLVHAFSGDGMHRNSIGSSLVPVQKKLNNAVELMQRTILNTIPVKWCNPEYVAMEALSQQTNIPGSYLKLAAIPPDGDLSKAFYVEEQLEVPVSLMPWILQLRDEFAQLLTGAYPAVSGDDTHGNDTAQGIAMQRDAAMGRIGTFWRNLKEAYASIMKNAVICVVENRQGTLTANIPKRGGLTRHLSVNVEDLRGNIECYPETEESYPESWVQRRGVITNLMQDNDPLVQMIRNLPENLVLIWQSIGLQDLTIPQVVAYKKQLGEIDELLESEPEPNPVIEQLGQQLQQLQGQLQQMAAHPMTQSDPAQLVQPAQAIEQQIQQVTQQLQQVQQTAPLVSSVPIDKDWDDHASELQTCQIWLNSEEGQQVKKVKPQEWLNVSLHGMAHKQALAAMPPPPNPKPVTKSVNAGDLIKGGLTPELAQLLSQAGITMQTPPAAPPPQQAA